MKFLFMVAAMTLVMVEGHATPKKYNNCEKNIKFEEVKWSSGVVFNEDCSTAYVLPPKGKMSITAVRPTGHIESRCDGYFALENTISKQFQQVEILTSSTDFAYARIKQLNEYLAQGFTPVGMTMTDLLNEIGELNKLVQTNMSTIRDMRNQNIEDKKEFSETEGGFARFDFESKYNELIRAYKKENPKINFVRMPVKQSYISIAEKTIDYANINPSMSAVLQITSDNIGTMPLLTNLYVEEKSGSGVQFPGNYFGDSTSGNLTFSALGICPLVEKYGVNMGGFSIDDVPEIYGNVTYQYEVQVERYHKVEINLHQLAKRVQESISKGGFLSRKNITRLTEKTEHESWIKVTVMSDDVDHEFKEEYTKAVVQEQMQWFLDQIAHVRFGQPGTMPQASLPTGQNGADVASGALSKCPHMYCQIGSYALKFISSTFGKTSALSEYTKMEDAWSIREVKDKKMVPLVGGYTFD